MYEFKDEFRTGIEIIDQEHKKLFEIADRAYVTLTDEFIADKFDYIVDILKELADYSVVHFQHEEEYMMSIRYKKLFSQKAEHQEFIEKFESYHLDDIDENQGGVMLEILDYLGNWLIHHILESDKLIGK